ncbi:hypothetical protein TWF730_008371 [Orbilia blumenaviensis]|uniref:RING-type domain-containing protein n=1 Tax=Orbilia blumenaviensis TaxID=1796055 RepID=A0AAV9V261_9PEZI
MATRSTDTGLSRRVPPVVSDDLMTALTLQLQDLDASLAPNRATGANALDRDRRAALDAYRQSIHEMIAVNSCPRGTGAEEGNGLTNELDDTDAALPVAGPSGAQPVQSQPMPESRTEGAVSFIYPRRSTVASARDVEDLRSILRTWSCEGCDLRAYEIRTSHSLAELPCGHIYCNECLQRMAALAARNEASYPTQCCGLTVTFRLLSLVLPDDDLQRYLDAGREFSSERRLYCANTRCFRFIPDDANSDPRDGTARCGACGLNTCPQCRELRHRGPCVRTRDMQRLRDLVRENGWQNCSRCGRAIERVDGCHHMTCVCGHEFCYTCGADYGTCECGDDELGFMDDDERLPWDGFSEILTDNSGWGNDGRGESSSPPTPSWESDSRNSDGASSPIHGRDSSHSQSGRSQSGRRGYHCHRHCEHCARHRHRHRHHHHHGRPQSPGGREQNGGPPGALAMVGAVGFAWLGQADLLPANIADQIAGLMGREMANAFQQANTSNVGSSSNDNSYSGTNTTTSETPRRGATDEDRYNRPSTGSGHATVRRHVGGGDGADDGQPDPNNDWGLGNTASQGAVASGWEATGDATDTGGSWGGGISGGNTGSGNTGSGNRGTGNGGNARSGNRGAGNGGNGRSGTRAGAGGDDGRGRGAGNSRDTGNRILQRGERAERATPKADAKGTSAKKRAGKTRKVRFQDVEETGRDDDDDDSEEEDDEEDEDEVNEENGEDDEDSNSNSNSDAGVHSRSFITTVIAMATYAITATQTGIIITTAMAIILMAIITIAKNVIGVVVMKVAIA